MTNTELFRKKVEEKGITIKFLALKIGITRESLYNKLNNETEFKASEISRITDVLELTSKERDDIFFANMLHQIQL